jgi:hypothetical protein
VQPRCEDHDQPEPYGRPVCDAHSPCFTPAKHARNVRNALRESRETSRNMRETCAKRRVPRVTYWPLRIAQNMEYILPILTGPKQCQYMPILSGAGWAPIQYFQYIGIVPTYLDPKAHGEVPQNRRELLQIASNSKIIRNKNAPN